MMFFLDFRFWCIPIVHGRIRRTSLQARCSDCKKMLLKCPVPTPVDESHSRKQKNKQMANFIVTVPLLLISILAMLWSGKHLTVIQSYHPEVFLVFEICFVGPKWHLLRRYDWMSTWRIIPVSKWLLITMVRKSCNWGCGTPSKWPFYVL